MIVLTKTRWEYLEASRHGLGLAPERILTFQNMQGKTVRGPSEEPVGMTADLFQPNYLKGQSREEFKQYLYMILGRARKLEWLLLRNLPRTESGEVDWDLFESGPPPYVEETMERLQAMHDATWVRLFCAFLFAALAMFFTIEC